MGKKVYRVKKGDDFFKISRKLYGDASYAMALIRANPGFDYVGPGMVLRLPKEDPRITRQRKIKRREKLYGSQTTTQSQPDLSQYESMLGKMENPEQLMENDYERTLSQDVEDYESGADLSRDDDYDWLNDPAFEDELIDLIAEKVRSMGLDESAMMYEFGLSEQDPFAVDRAGRTSGRREGGIEAERSDTSADVSGSPAGETEGGNDDEEATKDELSQQPADGIDLGKGLMSDLRSDLSVEEMLRAAAMAETYASGEGVGQGVIPQELATTGGVGSLPPPPTPKPEGNSPEENMYYNLYYVKTEKDLRAWKELLSRMGFSEENMHGFLELASIKEQELNSSRQSPFGNTVVPLAGFEDVILSSFQYQKDGKTTDNDCTEAAIAMLINMMMKKFDSSHKDIHFSVFARDMDKQWPGKIYRTPADFRVKFSPLKIDIEAPGLTPPFGARNYLQDYGKSHEPGWIADLSTYNTTDALLQNIMDGKPTMIYGVDEGIPHAVVPVGFDTATKKWIILNPGTDPGVNTKIYDEWTEQELDKFWNDNLFEGWLWVYSPRTMVTLYPKP